MTNFTIEFGHDVEHEPDFDDIRVGAVAQALIKHIPEREMFSFVRAVKMAYSHASDDHSRTRVQILSAAHDDKAVHFRLTLTVDYDGTAIEGTLTTKSVTLQEGMIHLRDLPQTNCLRAKARIGDFVELPFEGFADVEIQKIDTRSNEHVARYKFDPLPAPVFTKLYQEWA